MIGSRLVWRNLFLDEYLGGIRSSPQLLLQNQCKWQRITGRSGDHPFAGDGSIVKDEKASIQEFPSLKLGFSALREEAKIDGLRPVMDSLNWLLLKKRSNVFTQFAQILYRFG